MIQKILNVKNPKLRKKSLPILKFDKKVSALISDLRDTLASQKDPEGVGLAAPQIGKNLQVFLINYEKTDKIFINPKILKIFKTKSKKKKVKDRNIVEGCLSLPHYYGPLSRSNKLLVEYKNEKGETITEEFHGFIAQIIQHEVDHLNGVLFVDRILEQKKPLYKVKDDEWEEVELI